MSIEIINKQLEKFLQSNNPEILCLRGKWGVGKTFLWNTALQNKESISLKRYSYVSLFGITSLDELKIAIFAESKDFGNCPNKFFTNIWNKLFPNISTRELISHLPSSLKRFMNPKTMEAFLFKAVENQLICFDDLERRSERLRIKDILGLASFLKEQRKCKIALLLNDNALEDAEKQDFDTHSEKAIDKSLVYKPTSKEQNDIALRGEEPIKERTAELAKSLGITNIRTIKRIDQTILDIAPILNGFDDEVMKVASASLALFVWSYREPDEAPTLEYLIHKRTAHRLGLANKAEITEKEAAWGALLDSYNYQVTDEFDLELIEGVRNGFFDEIKIKEHAEKLQSELVAQRANSSLKDAWRGYHDSFDNDQDAVLDKIYASFKTSVKQISPSYLNDILSLFKTLGRYEQAKELLEYYVSERSDESELFDINESPFGSGITDPDLIDAFKNKLDERKQRPDLYKALLNLNEGWNDEILAIASNASVDDYYKILKETKGMDLRKILAGTLKLQNFSDASPEMRKISGLTKDALKKIGSESAINAHRVARYGIKN
jgi:hypothetical protein